MGFFDVFRSKDADFAALGKLISLMQRPELGRELPEFLQEDRHFRKQFLALASQPGLPKGDTTYARWRLSELLVSYALSCAEHGDMFRATASAAFAQAYARENVGTYAALAEIYLAWQDQIAMRYAQKAISMELPSLPGIMGQVISDPRSVAANRELKNRMRTVIAACREHPEWRDSYPLKAQSGLLDDVR